MLSPSVYDLSIDGVEIAAGRRLDQAVDHVYIGGDSCTHCPADTHHKLKVLVRSCVPFAWTLREATAGLVLSSDNGQDFLSQNENNNFSYIRDGTCQHLGLDVHTYWEETCVSVADLEHDCFEFYLGAHPAWPIVTSADEEEELVHAHRNTEVVLLFDTQQIEVDLALVGSMNAGPPSEINIRFGGACRVAARDDADETDGVVYHHYS